MLAILLAFLPLQPVHAQALEEAARLEAAGNVPGAVAAYRGWLKGNPAAPRTDDAFEGLFRLLTNLTDLLELSALPGLGAGSLLSLARLADMAGRYEEARPLYERAWTAGGSPEALIRGLTLSLEMNDGETARGKLEVLRSKDPGWAGLAEGLIEMGSGSFASAGNRLTETARSASDPRLRLAALWALLERARLSGDPAALEAASAEITARYPGSPEEALAAGSVAPLSRPGQFASAAVAAPLPRTEGPAEAGARFGVQAGSFKVRENADELAAELARKGFVAAVREDTREGKALYKVLAGSGLGRAAALEVLAKLSGAGYAGLLIFEAR